MAGVAEEAPADAIGTATAVAAAATAAADRDKALRDIRMESLLTREGADMRGATRVMLGSGESENNDGPGKACVNIRDLKRWQSSHLRPLIVAVIDVESNPVHPRPDPVWTL
ncbi:hypothetical protein GCM10009839_89960 [Catenulispora yoronensis]|uniref:Uncharacterized protein n=1 Tax=Catenulispora yoronensis TaxID=450799 RepID=A0ABP5H7C5_9ACTN